MDKATEQEVRRRAGYRCEYCQLPETFLEFKHEIDHIIARQHHGSSVVSNLALCCGRCNVHKGPNLSGIDPDTGGIERLFHPRQDRWQDHFRWSGLILVGVTPVGRATVDVLAINHADRMAARRQWFLERDLDAGQTP